jgi:hypothetical protein
MTDKVQLCLVDLQTKMASIQAVTEQVAFAYTIEQMLDNALNVKLPALTIVYEGLSPVDNVGQKQGLSSKALFGVYLLSCQGTPTNPLAGALTMLKSMRTAVMKLQAPSGHPWIFEGEAPTTIDLPIESGLVYRQAWSTMVIVP